MLKKLTPYSRTRASLAQILANGRTQLGLSKSAKVTRTLLSLILSGHANPTAATVGKVCAVVERGESRDLLSAYLMDEAIEVMGHYPKGTASAKETISTEVVVVWQAA